MSENDCSAGPMERVVIRLEALLPELEYSRETHVQWRDCPQHCRDRNPEIGSAEFHGKTVLEYDERIAAIKEAANELRRLGDILQKQGALVLMQEQELLALRGPLAPLPDNASLSERAACGESARSDSST